jgi:hypothetical protein
MKAWQPLIRMPFTRESRDATIEDFGSVVDAIEERAFPPPSPERLEEDFAGKGRSFAGRVCQNCDARFSCSSYRAWRMDGKKLRSDNVLDYFSLAENREEDEEYKYVAGDAREDVERDEDRG